jgi:hypothetical protein
MAIAWHCPHLDIDPEMARQEVPDLADILDVEEALPNLTDGRVAGKWFRDKDGWLEIVKASISEGSPIIARIPHAEKLPWWGNRTYRGAHFIVICGLTADEEVVCNDPVDDTERQTATREEFERAWRAWWDGAWSWQGVVAAKVGGVPVPPSQANDIVFAMSRGQFALSRRQHACDRMKFDIYTADLASGEVKQVTALQGISAVFPCWSPDRTKILFAGQGRQNGIYVMNRDGSGLKKLTDGEYARWSPDGQSIAFQRRLGLRSGLYVGGLYVMDVDGSNERQLIPPLDWDEIHNPFSLSWWPDARFIVFRAGPCGTREGIHGRGGVYKFSADGKGEPELIMPDDMRDYWRPLPSPDGRFIALESIESIHLYNMTTRKLRRLAGEGEYVMGDRYGWFYADHPAWSPDGQRLAFCARKAESHGSPSPLRVSLNVVNLKGETLQSIELGKTDRRGRGQDDWHGRVTQVAGVDW